MTQRADETLFPLTLKRSCVQLLDAPSSSSACTYASCVCMRVCGSVFGFLHFIFE